MAVNIGKTLNTFVRNTNTFILKTRIHINKIGEHLSFKNLCFYQGLEGDGGLTREENKKLNKVCEYVPCSTGLLKQLNPTSFANTNTILHINYRLTASIIR